MRTLEELRTLFVNARNIAKEANPERAEEAAAFLVEFSNHCKELYAVSETYLEKAKCHNLYTSIDNVVKILKNQGFCSQTVAAFFGFDNASGLSFSDVSAGRGYIKAPDTSSPSSTGADKKDTPIDSILSEEPGASGNTSNMPKKKLALPPAKKNPPPPADTPAEPADAVPPAAVSPEEPQVPPADTPESPDAPLDTGTGNNGEAPEPTTQGDPDDVVMTANLDALEPKTFDDFIGQTHIVNRLKQEISAAKKLGKHHLDHIMLFGNRGLGKSTLMRILANELGVKFEFIDCTSLRNDVKSQKNFNEFFIRISQMDCPVVIALDEIHALPERIQSNLLILLSAGIYNYLDENGTPQCLTLPEFTFIGATTDNHKVIATLRDRCKNLTFFLKDYTRDELKQIFVNKLGAMGLKTTENVCNSCINRCRSSIRDITAIVKGLQTKAINGDTSTVTAEMADEYFAERNVDALGLSDKEIEILNVLNTDYRGVLAEDTLAAKIYVDKAILTSEYEPYLIKIGFIEITGKGRAITQKARDYLKYGYYNFGNGVVIGEKPEKDS